MRNNYKYNEINYTNIGLHTNPKNEAASTTETTNFPQVIWESVGREISHLSKITSSSVSAMWSRSLEATILKETSLRYLPNSKQWRRKRMADSTS